MNESNTPSSYSTNGKSDQSPTGAGFAPRQALPMDFGMGSTAPAIEARGLRKVYGEHVAVQGANLLVWPGEIVGFLGPNGAGKTTTIRMLTGLLKPTAGTASVMGHDIQADPVRAKASF